MSNEWFFQRWLKWFFPRWWNWLFPQRNSYAIHATKQFQIEKYTHEKLTNFGDSDFYEIKLSLNEYEELEKNPPIGLLLIQPNTPIKLDFKT